MLLRQRRPLLPAMSDMREREGQKPMGMTPFFAPELHQVGSDDCRFDPVRAAIEPRSFRRKSAFVSNHRHSSVRENVFALRPREQLKPLR